MATALNLPAPAPFLASPGEPVMPWERWISTFDTYLLATGLDSATPERTRAILAHCLGGEGQRILDQLAKDSGKSLSKYSDAVEVLEVEVFWDQEKCYDRTV